jgi:hypothetical protein
VLNKHDGTFLHHLGGEWKEPCSIAIHPATGDIFVSDPSWQRVQVNQSVDSFCVVPSQSTINLDSCVLSRVNQICCFLCSVLSRVNQICCFLCIGV